MKKAISTTNAPSAIGLYSQAINTGSLIFTSGQLGIDPSSGVMAEGVEAQTRQALKNAQAVLAAGGSDLSKAVKATVFLQDMNDFAVMNEVYGEFMSLGILPARSAVQVARLPKDALVEIEIVAEV
jgi:2-iminobutanoate/2-iminopropanoate deaminase